MEIIEIRRILRKYGLRMRKRDTALSVSNMDCPYEVYFMWDGQREWRFNLDPEKYCSVEELARRIKYELREEYIPPLG